MKIGDQIGRWTIIDRAATRKYRQAYWLCRCSCGQEKEVLDRGLREATSRSCGCLQRELTRKRARTHGRSKTPTYTIWVGMLTRCYNKNAISYQSYGARGITLCKRWLRFENFLADMGERPAGLTIDRKNNANGYSKRNCRWVTMVEQGRHNRRVKLSMNKAARIRAMFCDGHTRKQLAARFSVSKTSIAQIIRGDTWQ